MFNNINPNDYQSRLHNSILMYEGLPVSLSLLPDNKFQLHPVHSTSVFKPKVIDGKDVGLDISTPPLGWVNFQYDGTWYAVYLQRDPVRKWRQGLCSTNTNSFYLSNGSPKKFGLKDVMYSKGFEDMTLNRYDPVTVAIKRLAADDYQSVALSRNIAIGKKNGIYLVYYKRDEVGYMNPGKLLVKVPKEQHSGIISKFLSEIPWEIE